MSYSSNDDEYEINASTPEKETVTVKYPHTKLQFYGTNGFPELFEWEDLLFARTCSYASWWYIPSKDLLETYKADVPGGDPMNDLRYEYFIVEDFSLRYCQTDPAFRYPAYCQFYFDNLISGPTVAEMLLIKAEVQARQGDWQGAMQTLVPLRKARIKAEAYTELTASSQADALQKILRERRRELAFVSRWYDMKRLNMSSKRGYVGTNAPASYRLNVDGRAPYWNIVITRGETQNNPIIATQNNPDPSGLIEPWKG